LIKTKFLADSKMFELDRYYKECQKNKSPFIKARKNPVDGNYVVQLDLSPCNYTLSKEKMEKINDLFSTETDFLNAKNSTKSVFKGCNIDKELVWYDGILPNRLNTFCETLFDLSEKYS